MNRIGIDNIRKETERKAKLLYDFATKCDFLEIFVKNPEHRSQTVVVVNTIDKPAAEIIESIKASHNMVIGSGYGDFKATQLRIANFAAVNTEQVEQLIDALKALS